jgi:hypothetical protein
MLAGVRRRVFGALVVASALVLAWAVLLGGIGGSGDDADPITGPGKQVADAVSRLERATRLRRFDVLCDELFTRSARARAGGRNCVALLRSTAKDVRRPRIRLLSVRVDGDRAQADVRTLSEGQAAIQETIDFQLEGGRYRIDALHD